MAAYKKTKLEIEGQSFDVQIENLSEDQATVLVDGRSIEVKIQPQGQSEANSQRPAKPALAPTPQAPTQKAKLAPPTTQTLGAMMPGTVSKVMVQAGQKVEEGQVLMILEAMKMENEIRSDRSSTIEILHVSEGQTVQTGEVMVTFQG